MTLEGPFTGISKEAAVAQLTTENVLLHTKTPKLLDNEYGDISDHVLKAVRAHEQELRDLGDDMDYFEGTNI